MKWAIFNPKTKMFIHPMMCGTFQEYETRTEICYFEDTHELTDFLRRIDENGNLSASLEGFQYMMILEQRP